MNAEIRTTGQLREFVTECMVRVKTGHMKPDQASVITKMAAQVNESFYSEAKIAKLTLEMGSAPDKLGNLAINGTTADK